MDRDTVIALAREAWDRDEDLWLTHEQYFLERFAALVAAAERERCYEFIGVLVEAEREECAKLCDHMASRCNDIRTAALEVAAENIRARGQA